MLTNGLNGLNPSTSVGKSVNGTPSSILGLQKAAAAAVAQQQQKQLQQQHSTQSQQQQHTLVNGTAVPVPTTNNTQSSYVGMSTTPMKARNNLMRNESPSSIGEKSPPRITPHASPIPSTLPANVHQVSKKKQKLELEYEYKYEEEQK